MPHVRARRSRDAVRFCAARLDAARLDAVHLSAARFYQCRMPMRCLTQCPITARHCAARL
eukprot:4306652-Pleurochrysis_carterae.AAC.1